MELRYFDAHCHPQFSEYDADRDAILTAMEEQDVGGLVVGADKATSRAACELVQDNENLFAAVGIHPHYASDPAEIFDEHEFRDLLAHPKTVAIGECGLDFFRPADVNEEIKKAQKKLFEKQVYLAGETKHPLVIHARPTKGTMDAYHDVLDILREAKKEYGDALKGDFHFFVGDTDIARQVFELDFHVSFTAVITFARDYDDVIRYAPLNRILAETDSPYVAPASRRGKRNDPLAVIDVVRTLAEVRGLSRGAGAKWGEDEETVRLATLENAKRLFAL